MGFVVRELMTKIGFKINTAKLAAFDKRLGETKKRINGMSQSIQGSLQGVRNVGVGLTAAVSLPLTLLGKSVLNSAGDFQEGMNLLGASTGATKDQITLMRKEALKLGSATVFSAREATEGMQALSDSGYNVTQIMQGIGPSLDLAAAGNLGLGVAADFASDVMNAFGLDASQARASVDTLARGSKAGATTLDKMIESFAQFGPVMHQAGISLHETTKAIALLGSGGRKASLAGTDLRGMVAALMKPTSEATKTLNRLGIANENLFRKDDPSKLKSLENVFKLLKKGGATSKDLFEIFRRTGAAGAGALLQAIGGGWEAAEKKMQKKSLTAKSLAEARMKGFNGMLKKMKASFEAMGIALGNAGILDWATKFVDMLSRIFSKISQLDPIILKFILILGGLTAAIPIIITLLASLALAVLSIHKAFLLLKPILINFGLVGIKAFGLLAAKILLIVGVIALIGFAIWSVYDDIKTWSEGGGSLIGSLLGSFEIFYTRVKRIFNLVKDIIISFWEVITMSSDTAGLRLVGLLGELVSIIGKVIVKVLEKIGNAIMSIDAIMGILVIKLLDKLMVLLIKGFTYIGKEIKSFFKEIMEPIGGFIISQVMRGFNFAFEQAKLLKAKVKGFFGFGDEEDKKTLEKAKQQKTPKDKDETSFMDDVKWYFGVGGKKSTPTTSSIKPLTTSGKAGVGSTTQNINVKSTVDLTLPEGTTEQQRQNIQKTADEIFDAKLNDVVTQTILANPQVEQ